MTRPTTWIAAALVAIAGIGVYLWFAENESGEWTPNITVTALAAALTITVIDRAVERERLARLKPRLEVVYERIGEELDSLCYTVATNYGLTHRQTFETLPVAAVDLMKLWDDRFETREPGQGLDESLVDAVERFSKALDAVRLRDSDALDSKLVRAIDRYMADIALFKRQAHDDGTMFAVLRMTPALRNLVVATEIFVEAFGSFAPRWVELDEDTRESAEALVRFRAGLLGSDDESDDDQGRPPWWRRYLATGVLRLLSWGLSARLLRLLSRARRRNPA